MEFIEFAKEHNRMCDSYEECAYCGLYRYLNKNTLSITNECMFYCFEYPNVAQEIVQKWVEENPVETRKSNFLRAFPNAVLHSDGYPAICVNNVFGKKFVSDDKCCETACYSCWNTPIESD